MTWRRVVEAWRTADAAALLFSKALADSPFEAFFWETPPLLRGRWHQPFSSVVVDAPSLARSPEDRGRFDGPMAGTAGLVARFDNLGGDAHLVAPTCGPSGACAHLASFLRQAEEGAILALWAGVGQALWEREQDPRPTWVSTSGLGVAWLQIRLARRPKYYTWAPFRGV
jgi:hypothetical protein